MDKFKPVSPLDLDESVFRMIGKEWMLLTAGGMHSWNTMTASWGAMGELWFKPVCFTFIRPQRYTAEFFEREELFTVSFFDEAHRDALKFCGSNSGRDTDKARGAGLTPFEMNGAVGFEEARLVLQCRKIYFQDLEPGHILDPDIVPKCYSAGDFHRMYIGEVQQILMR